MSHPPVSLTSSRFYQAAMRLPEMISKLAIDQNKDISTPDALATSQIYATLALAEQQARIADALEAMVILPDPGDRRPSSLKVTLQE